MRSSGTPARRLVAFSVLLLIVLFAVACNDPQSTVNPKSDNADSVQSLYLLVFWLGMLVFVGVTLAAVVFAFVFRERPGRQARQIHGNTRLEILWTFIPVVILVVMAVPTFQVIIDTTGDPPSDSLVIVATGHQWWFEFAYPGQGVTTANELHIPVNRPVSIKLLSDDVIHSFWVPQLSGKTDMVPGHENSLFFTPNEIGEYRGQCAEFCGTSHANMRFRVFVDSQEDFDAWVASTLAERIEPSDELATAGEQVFTTSACIGCHTVRGTVAAARVGPELTHFGSRDTVASGIMDNTPENVARWLRDPPAVKPGSKMPNLNLTEDQIQKLVAYLESLK